MNSDYIAMRIMEVLNRDARGRERAIVRDEVDRRLKIWCIDIGDRHFRDIYSSLPVCVCNQGMFIPIRPEEVVEYRRYLGPKIPPEKIEIKIRRILATWPALRPKPKAIQLDLDMGAAKVEART